MEPLWVFLFSGLVAMSGALSAGALVKLDVEARPAWAQSKNGQAVLLVMGNLFALTLIGALAYGFRSPQIAWWWPLASVLLTFPIVYNLVFKQLLGDKLSFHLCVPLVMVAIAALYHYW